MAKTPKFPNEQYGMWEEDGDEKFVVTNDTLEKLINYISGETGEVVEVAVYKLEKVIKVRRGPSYTIIK